MEESLLTAKELGFKPNYTPMDREQFEVLINLMFTESLDIPKEERPFGVQILDKRIEGLEFPIKMNDRTKLFILSLSNGNPGKIVTILIDCLTKFEGREATVENICEELYPMGFYSDQSFTDYVNNYLKPHRCKWSQVY